VSFVNTENIVEASFKFCWYASRYIRVMKTNLMQYLSLAYLVNRQSTGKHNTYQLLYEGWNF